MRVATSGMKPVFRPLTRVGCTRRLAIGVPDEWPSRRRKSPNRTRLTGQLTLFFAHGDSRSGSRPPCAKR